MWGRKIYVAIEGEDAEHSLVTVEAVLLNVFGSEFGTFTWLDFGQGKRIVLGLLDFLTERSGTQF